MNEKRQATMPTNFLISHILFYYLMYALYYFLCGDIKSYLDDRRQYASKYLQGVEQGSKSDQKWGNNRWYTQKAFTKMERWHLKILLYFYFFPSNAFCSLTALSS